MALNQNIMYPSQLDFFFYGFTEMWSSLLRKFPMMGNSLPCSDPLPILNKNDHNY